MTMTFRKEIGEALGNPNLAGALGRFYEAYPISRAKAYQGVDFEAVRTRIAEVKGDAAGRFPELVARFKKEAEARGAKVVLLKSPEEVRSYIVDLAREKGVKKVAKSKSMASEEVHLNAALTEAGIDVKETDLGEWIIQLAGQRPSHMVMPAIHLTKEDVAEIFSKEVGERLANDIPRLVKVAKKELRPAFLEADMGISGANIAVAETGTLVLVTNEGNARLVTTLPKIHVAIVGLEKLVPAFADVVPILTALPRSATGQLMTSYVSMITGAAPNTDGTPKELHIVLMDHRRSEMAADPVFKEALQCIRCASCLNVCPVYRHVGGHVFGDVYTGGIGTILTAWTGAMERSKEIQGLCIQCGNCVGVCPGKIDIPELIVEVRRRQVQDKGQPFVQKAIFKVVNNRRLFHSVLRSASLAQKPFEKDGFVRHLPFFLSGLADFRSLPAIADRPFRDTFKEIPQKKGTRKAAFYAGCLIDFAYPGMGEDVVKVLNAGGVEVTFPEAQTCCGAPARYSGAYEVAAQNAIDNLEALLAEEVDWVVSACPTCTTALKHEFARALRSTGKTEWLAKADALAAKVIDFSSLVTKLVGDGSLKIDTKKLPPVTYHDSCHLKRTLHVSEEPRALLRKAGHEVVEMKESDTCCGMGGSYSLKFPEISKPILQKKLANIRDTKAGTAAMDCPGCVMQIRGGFDKKENPVEVQHIARLLARALDEETPPANSKRP
ncbi:MAG: LUD domain-containing protein [Holophagales bacterium]|nr:LUD domain-containing protein [Holophagales bacterium]